MASFFQNPFGLRLRPVRGCAAEGSAVGTACAWRLSDLCDAAEGRRPVPFGGPHREKDGEETLVHEFVRADVFTSMDDAVEFTIRKAKLIIDQNGASLFP